jgi:CelD/BcsL family acetyltransferase involved in cellulose biosynthesis
MRGAFMTYIFADSILPFFGELNMVIDINSPRVWAVPARQLTCTVVTNAAEAEALGPAWSALQERCERNELTQSPDWLLTWWHVFGGSDGRQLRLGLFHDGDRLVGLTPLLRRRHWYRCLPFRRLEFLASGESAGDGICSNHLGVLAERGSEARVAHRFVEAVHAGAFGSWDEVVLPMMSGDTAMPELLVEAFRTHGYSAEAVVAAGAPYIPLPPTWDEYLRSIPSAKRKNINRNLRVFDTWSEGTTELECYATLADLEKGKKILIDLHHGRWASAEQAGVFRSPMFLRFHDEIMPVLAERGGLELLVLRARDEPVAAIYSMVWGGKTYTYQTGRRADLPTGVSAGGVVFALAIRRAIEQGQREFEMLADAVYYKQQLTPHTRPLVQIRATRTCLVEAARKAGVAFRAKIQHSRPAAMDNGSADTSA